MRAALNSSVLVGLWQRAAAGSAVVRGIAALQAGARVATDAFGRAARDRRSRRGGGLAAIASSSAVVRGLMTVYHAPFRAWPQSGTRLASERVAVSSALQARLRVQCIGVALVVAVIGHSLFLAASAALVPRLMAAFLVSIAAIGLVLAAAAKPIEGRVVANGVAVGVVTAAVYSLSPLAVLFAVGMTLVVWRASLLMEERERRRFVMMMIVAVLLRSAVVAILPFIADSERASFTSLFGDAVYAVQRSLWIRNVLLGVPVAPLQAFEAFHPVYGYTGYHYVLAYLQILFGPSPYGLHLFTAALFLTAAVVLHLQVRQSFGSRAAFGTLVVTLFLPTLFVWSVAPLKEAAQFFLTVVAIVGVLQTVRATTWRRRLFAAAIVTAALVAVPPLRPGALAMCGGGVALGMAVWIAGMRKWLAAACAVAVVAGLVAALQRDAIVDQARTVTRAAARRHIGHVFTRGSSYRALDARFYLRGQVDSLTDAEAARFLARSALAFAVEPTPWRGGSLPERLLLPQQLFWYVLVVFACRGTVRGWRRDRLLTCLLLGVTAAGMAVIAPNSGNIGTLVRHRDMIVPFVVALGVLGAARRDTVASVS